MVKLPYTWHSLGNFRIKELIRFAASPFLVSWAESQLHQVACTQLAALFDHLLSKGRERAVLKARQSKLTVQSSP